MTGLLNSSQALAATYTYDPFGNLLAKTGTLNQPFQFSTKPYDEKTGMSYYGYRFYSPAIGRWMNRDPLQESGGINLYGFVGNNPIMYIDPQGLWYVNIGFNLGWWSPGIVKGVLIGPGGKTYSYNGWGWMTSPGFYITFSTSDPTTGWCTGGGGGGLKFGTGGLIGWSINRSDIGAWSGEIGFMTPGYSITRTKPEQDQPDEGNKEIILP